MFAVTFVCQGKRTDLGSRPKGLHLSHHPRLAKMSIPFTRRLKVSVSDSPMRRIYTSAVVDFFALINDPHSYLRGRNYDHLFDHLFVADMFPSILTGYLRRKVQDKLAGLAGLALQGGVEAEFGITVRLLEDGKPSVEVTPRTEKAKKFWADLQTIQMTEELQL